VRCLCFCLFRANKILRFFCQSHKSEWDWDIYLVDSSGHETVKLDSFYIDDDDGTRVKHFIVPMSNTIQRYKIIVWALQGPNVRLCCR
jgi:hypothetical protein